jgi:hypothetical protein
MSEWLANQNTTESAEGRKRAAANAAMIERFLTELDVSYHRDRD